MSKLSDAVTQINEGAVAAEIVAELVAAQQASNTGKLAEMFAGCNDTKSTTEALKAAVLELSLRLTALETVLESEQSSKSPAPIPAATESPAPIPAATESPEPIPEVLPAPPP